MSDSDDSTSDRDQTTPAPPRRRRRWLRVLIAIIVLLLIVVVAVQAVLWSSIPKSLVLSALQKALGVKVEADTVRAGWWGNTRVENVVMTIPLEDEPFIRTGNIRVEHSSLLSLVIFGLELRSLDIDNPEVYLRQAPSGRWNVLDLLESMGASAASGDGNAPSGGAAAGERPKIPAIRIHNALVHVTDNAGRKSKVGPLTLNGRPSETAPELVWAYDLLLPDQLTVNGRVATGGQWRHDAKINVQNLQPLLSPFTPTVPDIKLAARWEGRAAAGVEGRLYIERLTVEGKAAKGAIVVSTVGSKITVTTQNLEILKPDDSAYAAVVGGEITYDSGQLKVADMVLRGPGIDLIANASVAMATQTGEISANWRASAAPAAIRHAGNLTAKLDRTFDGRVEATAAIATNGHMTANESRQWNGRVEFSAAGPRLDELEVTIKTPQFKLVGPRRTFDLDGLVAQLTVSEDLGDRPGGMRQGSAPGLGISLDSMRLRDTDALQASGYYLLALNEWELDFVGKSLPIPKIAPDALAVELRVSGSPELISLQAGRVAAGDTIMQATGSYEFARPEPLTVQVDVNHVPPETDVRARELGGKPTSPPLVEGRLAARGSVTGTTDPLKLKMVGQVQGVGVKLLTRDIGDISVKVNGYADQYRAQLWRDPSGPPLSILGGTWDLEAIHDLDQEATTLTIGLRDLPLKEVGDLIGNDTKLAGTVAGNWTFYVPTYVDVKNEVRAGGKLEARNVVAGGYQLDSIDAWTVIEDGRMGLEPVIVRRENGVFTAKPSISLDNLKSLEINDLRLENWPLALPPSTYLTINASAPRVAVTFGNDDQVDAARLAPGLRFDSGPITAHTTVQLGDIDAGDVRLNATLIDRRVEVTLLNAKLFESRLEARGSANLDAPNAMTASFVLNGVDPVRVSKLVPSLDALSGSFDLRGVLGPVVGPDALEPLAVDVFLTSRNVYYRPATGETNRPSPGISVGDGRFQAQMRLDPFFQMERAVLTDQSGVANVSTECPPARTGPLPVNTIEAAGGLFNLWGRMVRNENDRGVPGLTTLSSHFRIGFRCLNLDQILQAFKPDDQPVPGLIDGSVVLYGTTRMVRQIALDDDADLAVDVQVENPVRDSASRPATRSATQPSDLEVAIDQPELPTVDETFLTSLLLAMQGNGQIRLTKSDLGNIKTISFLYNAMRLGQDVRQPTGDGQLDFRVENGDVFLDAFRYFNRGVEVRAVGKVFKLQDLQDAPVQATAYGSIRTLKDVQLPIIRSVVPDIEEIIAAIQQSGTSISVSGTLGDPKMRIVVFEELGQSMRELLLGDYKTSQKAPVK